MPALAEKTDTDRTTVLEWDPGEEPVVPNCHYGEFAAFSWNDDEDTIVPGHHSSQATSFTWADRA